MSVTTGLIIGIVLFSVILIGILVARPAVTVSRGGKILAFVALFILPIFSGLLGVC
jgi:hypothetical protein